MQKNLVIFVFILCALCSKLMGQFSVDTTSIKVGDIATLTITTQATDLVIWPQIKDTLTKEVEIIGEVQIDSTKSSKKWSINITAFDSGYYAIPPLVYSVNGSTQETNAFLLSVFSVPVDTSAAPMPIANIIHVPFSFKHWLKDNWKLIGMAILAMLLAIWLYKYLKNRKNLTAEPTPAPKPVVPIEILALEKLNKIKSAKIWQKGDVKGYYAQISEALRFYIEGRYQFPALEMSNSEIFDFIKRKPIPANVIEQIESVLFTSDLAKFAKVIPTAFEHEDTLSKCFDIVEKTTQKAAEVENKTS
ncbi:MAG: BatD family protein [Luteibaculaceae bacterium]